MAHSVDIGGVTYVPANMAGSKVGYSSDYVARLAREKKIAAQQVGRQWFVDPISLENFYADANRKKKSQQEKLRKERVAERKEKARAHELMQSRALQFAAAPSVVEAMRNVSALGALMKSAGVMVAGVFAGLVFYGSATGAIISPLPHAQIVMERAGSSLSQSALSLEGFLGAFSTLFAFFGGSDTVRYDKAVATDTSRASNQETTHDNTGVVVFEEGTYTDEELESLKRSFSDDVLIARDADDPNAGIITPIFKSRSDERYRFLLVPVAEGSEP